MRMPNLFWRGIIITMIPLVLQLTIVAFLAHFLLMIKNEIVMESQSQEIIARAFVLNRDAMETIYNLSFTFQVMPEIAKDLPKIPSNNPEPLKALTENLQGLFNVARVDAESAEKMRELHSCHKQLVNMFEDTHKPVFQTNEERVTAKTRFIRRFIQSAGEYANATNEIVALEEARQAKRPALINDLMKRIWQTLFVALGVSAALAALLGYLYIALVKRPLKRTCENGVLLAKGLPLPEAIPGNDELATLDRLLHATAFALETVENDEKTLVENAADLICSLSESGAFLNVNPFAYRMLGWTPDELKERNLNELTIAEESFTCDARLRETRNSTNINVFDLRLQAADKNVIDTRWSCFWSDAQQAFFCVAHDITQTKNAERMKQDLVDMISHDLRSPLTSVSISLAILSRGAKGELPPQEKEKIDRAEKIVEQLIELVSDLLDFQKLSARKIELDAGVFKLSDVLKSAVTASESSAERKDIITEISGDAPNIRGDKQLLLQAFSAALDNAVKAAPDGSTISIEITEVGDTVQVRIIDQGAGLSDDEISQLSLAVPTQKLSSSGNRSLLKFSICKQIIEAHNGNISFYSLKPSGHSFVIRLPKLGIDEH